MVQSRDIRKSLTPEEQLERKRKYRKRRLIVYGSLAALVYAFWVWVPWEYDFIPRKLPNPNPPVDPDTAHLFSPGTKVLVVTAHPDDSAFYIGGLLTQLGKSGAEIDQIICTDGDKAYYWIFAEPETNRKVRRAEAIEELHTWGGQEIFFLGKPDGRLRADTDLVGKIRAQIDRFQPEYVLCFDGDYPPRLSHQDHRRAGEAAAEAAKGAPSVRWLLRFSTVAPNWVRKIDNEWDSQKKLLQIHKSQFHGQHLERVTSMVESNAIADGERIAATYAEGFRCIPLK